MTLVSNSSMKAYPINSIAAFTVDLAHEIMLSGKDRWEVALCEFSCPVNSIRHDNAPRVNGQYERYGLLNSDMPAVRR